MRLSTTCYRLHNHFYYLFYCANRHGYQLLYSFIIIK
uniref:Uncharacterized protein n=1 Tax=Siphoviridae sp. ctr2f5 TaxID=2825684 RepID=A0A8S5QEM4_9CAUD|nr:MAG TPA: hypothetical protein [Siphoviridae sp. ctr2f5]